MLTCLILPLLLPVASLGATTKRDYSTLPEPPQVHHPQHLYPQQYHYQQQFPDVFQDMSHQVQQQQPFFPDSFQGTNEVSPQEEEEGESSLLSSLLGGGGLWEGMRGVWRSLMGGGGGWVSSMMALPLMLPMAALPLGMGALALMAFPILQLTLPGIRRSFQEGANLTHSVLSSEECLERLSCHLAKRFPHQGLMSRVASSESKWLSRVAKSVRAGRGGQPCAQYHCSPINRIQSVVSSILPTTPTTNIEDHTHEHSQ